MRFRFVPIAAFALFFPAIPAFAADEDPLAFRFPIAGVAVAGPFEAGGRFWTVSADKMLYVVFPDGRVSTRRAWKDGVPSWFSWDPYGRALTETADGTLILLDGYGREIRRFKPDDKPIFPAAFGADGRSFLLSNTFLSCRSANGALLWKEGLTVPPSAGPVVFDPEGGRGSFVAYGDGLGALVVLTPTDSARRERTLPGRAAFILGLRNADSAALLAVSEGGKGSLFDVADLIPDDLGLPVEPVVADPPPPVSVALPGRPVSMASTGDRAYGVLADGTVFALGMDGALAWTTKVALADIRELRAFPERVVILSTRGAVSLSASGEIFRELAIRNASGAPAFDASGVLCSPGADWILYAYRFEKKLTAAVRTPAPQEGQVWARSELGERFWWLDGPGGAEYRDELLAEVEKSLESGSIGGAETSSRAFLTALALQGLSPTAGRMGDASGGRFSDPVPRVKACALLGALGSPSSTDALVEAFRGDPDPAVRAVAARAIGTIGLDPTGSALAAFERAAYDTLGPDEDGALAVIGAIEGISRGTGRTDDPTGVRALIKLSQRPYPQNVRKRAQAALDWLRKR